MISLDSYDTIEKYERLTKNDIYNNIQSSNLYALKNTEILTE